MSTRIRRVAGTQEMGPLRRKKKIREAVLVRRRRDYATLGWMRTRADRADM